MPFDPFEPLRKDLRRISGVLIPGRLPVTVSIGGISWYRIFIPVKDASVVPGSIYWKEAEFREDGQFIQTTYVKSGETPKVAAMQYIYGLPERDIPTEVYAEGVKDHSDSGRFSGPELKREIVEGVTREHYEFIRKLKQGRMR